MLRHPYPLVGLADIGYLGFPIVAVVALAIFPSDVSRVGRWRMTLDGLMIACAIGLVSWATVLGAVVRAGGDSPLALGGRVAYPASDIALLVVCSGLSRSRAHRVPLSSSPRGSRCWPWRTAGSPTWPRTRTPSTARSTSAGSSPSGARARRAGPGRHEAGPRHDLPMVAGAAMPYVILGGSLA